VHVSREETGRKGRSLNYKDLRLLTEFHQQAVENAAKQRLEENPSHQAWCTARRITWMILLAGAFLFFHLISKMHEALTLL
jgi:hypothetical protein